MNNNCTNSSSSNNNTQRKERKKDLIDAGVRMLQICLWLLQRRLKVDNDRFIAGQGHKIGSIVQ